MTHLCRLLSVICTWQTFFHLLGWSHNLMQEILAGATQMKKVVVVVGEEDGVC
jgi:hypothetical protein